MTERIEMLTIEQVRASCALAGYSVVTTFVHAIIISDHDSKTLDIENGCVRADRFRWAIMRLSREGQSKITKGGNE